MQRDSIAGIGLNLYYCSVQYLAAVGLAGLAVSALIYNRSGFHDLLLAKDCALHAEAQARTKTELGRNSTKGRGTS